MKALALLLTLLLMGCESAEVRVKPATVYLEFAGGTFCSGTFIGPSLLMTASHCLQTDSGLIIINNQPSVIVSVRRDSGDTAIAVVDYQHPYWVKLGPKPKQGDVLFYYGNPGADRDLIRRGYVAGETGEGVMVDISLGLGDSGAGLFNERGEVVGVVSAIRIRYPAYRMGIMRPVSEGFLP